MRGSNVNELLFSKAAFDPIHSDYFEKKIK